MSFEPRICMTFASIITQPHPDHQGDGCPKFKYFWLIDMVCPLAVLFVRWLVIREEMFGNSFFKARLTEFKNCFLNDYSKDIWLMANVGPGVVWPTWALGQFLVIPKNL